MVGGTDITTIGSAAFQDCSKLNNIATIPASLATIECGAFTRTNIPSFSVDENNPSFSTSSQGVLLNKNGDTLLIFPSGRANICYTVESGITTIAEYGFSNTKINSVIIPKEVTNIGQYAIGSCENMTTATFNGSIPPTIGTKIFSSCNYLTNIFVPSDSVDAYKAALSDYSAKIKGVATTSAELKTALESTAPKNITVTADVSMDSDITIGADHTVNIENGYTLSTGENSTWSISTDKTLTLTGEGDLKVNYKDASYAKADELDNGIVVNGELICNGINVSVESNQSNGGLGSGVLLGNNAKMKVNGGTLIVKNSNATGISGNGTLVIDNNCSVEIRNLTGPAGATTNGINTNLDVKNSTILIETEQIGLLFGTGMNFGMTKSTINIVQTGVYGMYFNAYAQIVADNFSKFDLAQGAKLYSVNNKFSDTGFVLTNKNLVLVGATDATPSADGLSAGEYVWNGTLFAKGSATTPGTTPGTTGGSTSTPTTTTYTDKIKDEIKTPTKKPIELQKQTNNEFKEITAEIVISKATNAQKEALKKMTAEQIQAEIKKVTDAIKTVNTTKNSVKAKEKIAEVQKSLPADAKIMPINFTAHATFAFPVEVTIPVDKSTYPAGTYYLYYFNEETGKLEDCGTVTVDSNGIATFTISHCSDYFISSKVVDLSATAPKTITAATTTKETVNTAKNPKSGINSPIRTLSIMTIISVATLVVVSKKRNFKVIK